MTAVPPPKVNSSQKPGAEKPKTEKHATASDTDPPVKETGNSENEKSSVSDKTKAYLKQNMLQGKCDAPKWNVGDFWKFPVAEIRIIRIEEDLYIAEDSSSSDLVGFDKNTLEKNIVLMKRVKE